MMRYVILASAAIGVVWLATYVQTLDQSDVSLTGPIGESGALEAIDQPAEKIFPEKPSLRGSSLEKVASQATAIELGEPGVINIGPPMDPDDPTSWTEPETAELVNIGPPMDPDDPSTWSQLVNAEVLNVGEPMDPDDPSTWSRSESHELINIGELMDPDDPSTWSQPGNTEVINIGEYIDPDNP